MKRRKVSRRSRARKVARAVMEWYRKNRGAVRREDLAHDLGLTAEEVEKVYGYLVDAERHPEYEWMSEESGGYWRVPINEKDLAAKLRATSTPRWQCGNCGVFNEGRDLSAACRSCGEDGTGKREANHDEQG